MQTMCSLVKGYGVPKLPASEDATVMSQLMNKVSVFQNLCYMQPETPMMASFPHTFMAATYRHYCMQHATILRSQQIKSFILAQSITER